MMRTFKVPVVAPLVAAGVLVLFGCPIYSSSGSTFSCNDQGSCCDQYGDNCSTWSCGTNNDCPAGASCNYAGLCIGGGGSYDAGGSDGDASEAGLACDGGCAAGFTCTITNGSAQCEPNPVSPIDAGFDATKSDASEGGSHPSDGSTSDATDSGKDVSTTPPFTGCTSDNACVADAGTGARCLDGQCVAAANQCFDTTQCPVVNGTQEQCVSGVCTPSCANGAACPTGYGCNTTTNVCTLNPTPCGAADGGMACASGTTCVDERCVPVCTKADGGDAGPSCAGSGFVCVDNGCIPDQSPTFVCAEDGQSGSAAETCAGGSVCLHHNCYIACTLSDAGGDAGSTCKQADNFNVCKPVTTQQGTFDVCGSTTNLGSQCSPTDNSCTGGQVCIDGYCR